MLILENSIRNNMKSLSVIVNFRLNSNKNRIF